MRKKVCSHSSVPSVDRISNLAEPIRDHIISFLPMQIAIIISALSKTWKYVAASLPNIELNQDIMREKLCKKDTFRTCVDRLLIGQDRADVGRFQLYVRLYDDIAALHVNSWISYAIRKNVQELYLENHLMAGIRSYPCPLCVFNCSTLTVLILCHFNPVLPTTVVLPALKRMELTWVKFNDSVLTQNWISKCPLLEYLKIQYWYLYMDTLDIAAPNLKMLEFVNSRNCEVNISSPELHQIRWRCRRPPTICPETLLSVIMASFQLDKQLDSPNESNERESKILMGLQNVVEVSLDGAYIEL